MIWGQKSVMIQHRLTSTGIHSRLFWGVVVWQARSALRRVEIRWRDYSQVDFWPSYTFSWIMSGVGTWLAKAVVEHDRLHGSNLQISKVVRGRLVQITKVILPGHLPHWLWLWLTISFIPIARPRIHELKSLVWSLIRHIRYLLNLMWITLIHSKGMSQRSTEYKLTAVRTPTLNENGLLRIWERCWSSNHTDGKSVHLKEKFKD